METAGWKMGVVVGLLLLVGQSTISRAEPMGTGFTYHGWLTDGNQPAEGLYDFQFNLFDAPTDGQQIAGTIEVNDVNVVDGHFAVELDFCQTQGQQGRALLDIFGGDARWLEIGVRTNGSAGDFTPLSPRQPLTPSPYALYAANADTATTAANATAVAANGVTTASLQANAVTTDKIADGAVGAADLSSTVLSNTFWRLSGNAGTTPGAVPPLTGRERSC